GNTATGTGTNWTAPASQIRVGQTLFVLSNPVQMFQITAINSATSLTITPAASPALSGQKYGILVTDSLSVDGLAQSMSQLINEYDENIGAWETFATTSANQNITVTINGTRITIPAIGKLAQKGSNGAIPISQGGTGATTAEDSRTNLGLGSSATRNAYSSTGQMLSRGDFGLGGPGNSNAGWDIAVDGRFLSSPYDGPSATAVFMGINCAHSSDSSYCFQLGGRGNQGMWWRARESASFLPWLRVYDTGNTTRASDGTLKAASPVVKLFADGSFETNGESEGCTVTRMKAGEYLIEGCMGMNSDAAWGGIDGGFDIPKDRNGQALIWLDYEVNADGSVLVKTFHREYPSAPIFARNSREGFVDGEPADIPADQFVSVRVEMPQNSIWNQRAAMAEVSDSSSD
uniref:phage tail fiber protein n=3 Tax=Enterobacteriaceae TaxID=543 RepID=UPI00388DE82D